VRGGGRKGGCRLVRGREGDVLMGQRCGNRRGRFSMLEGLFRGGLEIRLGWWGEERCMYFVNLMM